MGPQEYKEHIAERLKAARAAREFTQAELASLLNVYPSQIARWESGKHLVDLYNAHWLAQVLGVTMDSLFSE